MQWQSDIKVNINIKSNSEKLIKKHCNNDFIYLNKANTVDLCFRAHCEERPEILYFYPSVFFWLY